MHAKLAYVNLVGGPWIYYPYTENKVNSFLWTIVRLEGKGRGCGQSSGDGCDGTDYHRGSCYNNGRHLKGSPPGGTAKGLHRGYRGRESQTRAMVKEVITDRGQEGDAQVEDSLPEEHPNTIVATGLSLF